MELFVQIPKCRICLRESENLSSIFAYGISEKIEKYSGISISKYDSFPQNICKMCIEEFNLIENFIKKCRQSDDALRQSLEFKYKDEIENLDTNYDHSFDIKMENDDLPLADIENSNDETKLEVFEKTKVKGFKKAIKRKKQSKTIKSGSSFICDLCGIHAVSRSAMIVHRRAHTGEKPFECNVCLKSFSQRGTLQSHIQRRHNKGSSETDVRQYFCEVCGKIFKNTTALKVHIRVHNDERPYKCEECGKRFTQLGSLTIHVRRHRGERPYTCYICQKSFVEMTHLKRHSSVHSEARPFVCNVCGKGVKSSFALKQHLKLHSNKKEHICDKCGMSFTIKGTLDSHVRVVHSEKSGQCSICNKIYSNLSDHMPIHTGEKSHSCDICDKRFSRKRGLIIHRKQHTVGKKYECDVPECGKKFYAQWILDCHYLKHSGKKPFTCKFCKKGFIRLCHLTKHIKINHPNENSDNVND